MSPSNPPAAAPSPLSLERQICYAMHTTVRAFDGVYRELLAEHGLSYPQYIALMTIGEHGPVTVGRLGELMRLDSGTLSPLLKRMEGARLVGRARDPEDERRVVVSLTAGGRERLDSLGDVPHRVAERSGLSRQQLVDLHRTLRQITESLDSPA
ncbi:MarR family transcriptional regulator [Terrabacter tumescens]|uniref:MarR family transcriptional regulator n=1 Tax=Terrabacter tumescens TaxID=60443 RepID=A0ABQ2I7H3_9MICO|nr:MarR family transcriptional regulator [Terrabacter tumescens]GGN01700.1 MarR family transcriptional regulator [Terrabacter tumescens]